MTYHQVCNKSNMTGVTSGAGTATFLCTWVSPLVFSGFRVAQCLVYCVMFCRSLFVLLAIALFVLWFTCFVYPFNFCLFVYLFVYLMVCNTTFNNISVTSWRSVLLVEKTGGPGEHHRPVVSHWQILSYNVVYLALIEIRNRNISGDCIGSCKSNYHTITALITPLVSSTFSYLYLKDFILSPFGCQALFMDQWLLIIYAFCFIGFMKSKKFKVSDGQQFHQYQQNELSPLTLTHWTQKNDHDIWYVIGNPCSGLGQAQNVVGLNQLTGSPMAIHI
jgi:hypothetical protein